MSDVGRIEWAPDYGKQDVLFDPRTTQRPKCSSCGTTAKNACQYDADRAADASEYRPRPKGCIASAQLTADQDLPF